MEPRPLKLVRISTPALVSGAGDLGNIEGALRKGEWSYSEKKKMLKEKGNLILRKIRSKRLCKPT